MALINPLLGSNLVSGDAPFDTTTIPNSVWFDTGDHFTQDTAAADSGRKEAIFSTWVQRTVFGAQGFLLGVNGSDVNDHLALDFQSTNKLKLTASSTTILETTQIFEDTAWYHILVTIDTSRNDDSSQKIFVNGVEVTGFSTRNNFGSSADIAWGRNATHLVNSDPASAGSNQMVGYMAQTALITDKSFQQGDFSITDFLDSFAFGTHGSQFSPKKNSAIATMVGTGGNNSFFLNYETASDLGNDGSSKNNDFSDVNMAAANQETHTPSKSYSIFNPLITGDQGGAAGTFTLTEGGQKVAIDNSNSWLKTTVPFEMSGSNIIRTQFTVDTVGNAGIGISGSHHCSGTYHTSAYTLPGRGEILLLADGSLVIDGDFSGTSGYTSALTNGDVVDVIVNLNAGAVYFAVDGTLCNSATQSEIQAGTTTNAAQGSSFVRRTAGEVFNFMAAQTNPNPTTITYNSGHSSFSHSYSTITSLISLNSADLPTPSFQGKDFFDATIYTGNGTNQRVGDFIPFTDTFAISNSAMFNNADIRRLAHTYSSESAATSDNSSDASVYRKATLSFWIKSDWLENSNHQTFLSQSNSGQTERFMFFCDNPGSSNNISATIDTASEANRTFMFDKNLLTSQEWSHFLLHLDTNNATAADRMKVFINGNAVTSTADFTGMTQGLQLNLFRDEELYVGHLSPGDTYNANYALNSYLAEFHLIDGSCQAASNFGQVDTSTNRWIPKDYKTDVGTYGNRGFYLKFDGTPGASSGSNMGKDSSGNGIHLTEENGSGGAAWATGDQFIDTPSSNFATIFKPDGQTDGTISEGGTKLTGASDSMVAVGWSENDPAIPSGKWFIEVATGTVTGGNIGWGMSNVQSIEDFGYPGQQPNQAGTTFSGSGSSVDLFQGAQTAVATNISLGFTMTTSDVGVIAYDADTKEMWLGFWDAGSASQITWISGSHSATTTFPSTNPTFTITDQDNPIFAIYATNSSHYISVNTGSQMTFNGTATTASTAAGGRFLSAAAIPTGFKALTVDNFPDTASKITAWAWIKNREQADDHVLVDRVRGVGKVWESNTNTTAFTTSNTVQRFLQRGVQIGDNVTVNTNNEDYVLWQWLLGDSATTGSTTSPAGTIASTTIVAAASHFSVGTYTGDGDDNETIGHGLGGIPEMIIVRNLSRTTFGLVWHTNGGGATHTADFAATATFSANNEKFGGSDASNPTANVFKIGDHNEINADGESFVFYAFRSIPGVCKVGVYQGSNEANGPFVALGFKPAFFMAKNIDSSGSWFILDSKRGFNSYLEAEDTATETTGTVAKQFADGIKWATTGAGNAADTFVYLAMADIGGNGELPPIYGV